MCTPVGVRRFTNPRHSICHIDIQTATLVLEVAQRYVTVRVELRRAIVEVQFVADGVGHDTHAAEA